MKDNNVDNNDNNDMGHVLNSIITAARLMLLQILGPLLSSLLLAVVPVVLIVILFGVLTPYAPLNLRSALNGWWTRQNRRSYEAERTEEAKTGKRGNKTKKPKPTRQPTNGDIATQLEQQPGETMEDYAQAPVAAPRRRRKKKAEKAGKRIAVACQDETTKLETRDAIEQEEDAGEWETMPTKHTKKAVNKNRSKFMLEIEEADGLRYNVLDGLSLHEDAITEAEAAELVKWCQQEYVSGVSGQLKGKTFMQSSSQRKAEHGMKRNGRQVLQYGVFYDYAQHRISPETPVATMPACLCVLIEKLEKRNVLPENKRMDSCIVNHYNIGDCIPPHIDHKDYPRPFCTLSLMSTASILFDKHIRVPKPDVFVGGKKVPLPERSVLVLEGNGANVAQHCVPPVLSERISITFRRMPEWVKKSLVQQKWTR
jgi:alkylated DNA repair protein alkB family protein 5